MLRAVRRMSRSDRNDVHRPCSRTTSPRTVWRTLPLADDVGLRHIHIRSVQADIGVACEGMVLHRLKGVDKSGPAIGIDEMISAVDGSGHRIGLLRGGNPEGDGQHDGVPIRHHRDPHGVFGIVPVGHVHIISQRRAAQVPANIADIDNLVRNSQPLGADSGKAEFLFVPLAVIERKQANEFLLGRHLVSERNRVQSAGADDEGIHGLNPCFDRVRLRPEISLRSHYSTEPVL